MSSHQLFIVDTKINREDAVTYAQKMYAEWVQQGIIEHGFAKTELPGVYEVCFKVNSDYALLHEVAFSQILTENGGLQKIQAVYGISINVLGHSWVENNGFMSLKPVVGVAGDDETQQRTDGFFYNQDGGFYGCCPACLEFVDINDDGSGDAFGDAVGEWLDSKVVDLECDICGIASPIVEWHSDTFALGCLGVTLNGVEVLQANQEQIEQLLQDLGFAGSDTARFELVSCRG